MKSSKRELKGQRKQSSRPRSNRSKTSSNPSSTAMAPHRTARTYPARQLLPRAAIRAAAEASRSAPIPLAPSPKTSNTSITLKSAAALGRSAPTARPPKGFTACTAPPARHMNARAATTRLCSSPRASIALVVLLCAALLLAGCGSSGGEEDTTTAAALAEKQTATQRKLERLRVQLRQRKRALQARRVREARVSATAGGHAVGVASPDASSSFGALEAELDGEIGAAIGAPGSDQVEGFGSLSSGSAWSTSKVPIALRLLQDTGGPSGLSEAQAEGMRRALTESDNEAAAALFADLERMHGGITGASAAVGEVLREAGDETTQISTQGRDGFSSYGQTDWSLLNQERFMSALAAGCISSQPSREYVL